jgi:hypothetical protein
LSPQGVDLVRAPDATALVAAIERLHGYDVVVIDAPAITATFSFSRRCAPTSWFCRARPDLSEPPHVPALSRYAYQEAVSLVLA